MMDSDPFIDPIASGEAPAAEFKDAKPKSRTTKPGSYGMHCCQFILNKPRP